LFGKFIDQTISVVQRLRARAPLEIIGPPEQLHYNLVL